MKRDDLHHGWINHPNLQTPGRRWPAKGRNPRWRSFGAVLLVAGLALGWLLA